LKTAKIIIFWFMCS